MLPMLVDRRFYGFNLSELGSGTWGTNIGVWIFISFLIHSIMIIKYMVHNFLHKKVKRVQNENADPGPKFIFLFFNF